MALFALFPVAAALWGWEHPFTFSAGLFIGGSAGFVIFLIIRFRGLFGDGEVIAAARRRCRERRMALWVLGHMDIGIFTFNMMAVPFVGALAAWRGEELFGGALLGGFVAGVALAFPYSALQCAAMLSTDGLGVGVIRYFLPLMSLGWLWAQGMMGEVDAALLCAGAVVIMLANVGAALFGWGRERRDVV